MTSELFDKSLEEELEVIAEEVGRDRFASGRFELAARLFSQMTNNDDFDDFLTVAAYEHI